MPRYKSLPKTKVKKTNEFVSAVDHAVRFLGRYKRFVLLSLVVAALGGLSILVFQQKKENHLENLNKLVFQAGGVKEGRAEVSQEVFEEYGRYPLAQAARLFLVGDYLKRGENDKALDELSLAAEKGPLMLLPLLKFSRAELLWQMGRAEDALKYINSTEKKSGGTMGGYFKLLQGQILESLGKKEEAQAVYQQIFESEMEDPFLRERVEARLVRLSI